VVKDHAQQCTLVIKQLCSQCGPLPHAETNNPFHFLPTENELSQTLPVSRNVITSRCIVVLFGTSLSGYTLLNVSRTAGNDFDSK
jgi:hypothetical protein